MNLDYYSQRIQHLRIWGHWWPFDLSTEWEKKMHILIL